MTGHAILQEYSGKEVTLTTVMGEVHGVLKEIDVEKGYVDFLPFINQEGDGKKLYVEKETPLRVGLDLVTQDTKFFIRPHKEGYLEERVKRINEDTDKEKRRMGYNLSQ